MTGRDIEERELSLKLEGLNWTLEGDAAEHGLSQRKKEIFNYLRTVDLQAPKEVAKALSMKLNTVQGTLIRMCKDGVVFNNAGRYGVINLFNN